MAVEHETRIFTSQLLGKALGCVHVEASSKKEGGLTVPRTARTLLSENGSPSQKSGRDHQKCRDESSPQPGHPSEASLVNVCLPDQHKVLGAAGQVLPDGSRGGFLPVDSGGNARRGTG